MPASKLGEHDGLEAADVQKGGGLHPRDRRATQVETPAPWHNSPDHPPQSCSATAAARGVLAELANMISDMARTPSV